MSKKAIISTYLAGAIEAADDLGTGWRNKITPILEAMGIKVVDPCIKEKEKLKGFHPNRKFPPFEHWATGDKMDIKHWHEAKNAPTNSDPMRRFCRYMNTIIKEDLKLIDGVDFLIVKWDENARLGCGTYHEILYSGKDKPVYMVAETDIPAWMVPFVLANGERFKNFESLLEFLSKEFSDN